MSYVVQFLWAGTGLYLSALISLTYWWLLPKVDARVASRDASSADGRGSGSPNDH